MIIWSRWGILALPFAGLGALIGFGLHSLLGFSNVRDSALTALFIGVGLLFAAAAFYAFERFVMRVYLDKARPVTLTQPAVQLPDGTVQPPRVVPAVNPETGQPLWVQPTSTLFFIPVRFWPYVFAAIGVVMIVVNIVAIATR